MSYDFTNDEEAAGVARGRSWEGSER